MSKRLMGTQVGKSQKPAPVQQTCKARFEVVVEDRNSGAIQIRQSYYMLQSAKHGFTCLDRSWSKEHKSPYRTYMKCMDNGRVMMDSEIRYVR